MVIYSILNQHNGKQYVGQTNNLLQRKKEHLSSLRRNCHYNPHLQRAYNIYGETALLFKVLEKVECASRLVERENYYIQLYETADKRKGYNMCPVAGSMLGYKHTKESREKLSKAKKGRPARNKGIPLSPEQKEKHSNFMRENTPSAKLTPDEVREIRVLLAERKLLQREIAEIYNINRSNISRINTGAIWGYVDSPEMIDMGVRDDSNTPTV